MFAHLIFSFHPRLALCIQTMWNYNAIKLLKSFTFTRNNFSSFALHETNSKAMKLIITFLENWKLILTVFSEAQIWKVMGGLGVLRSWNIEHMLYLAWKIFQTLFRVKFFHLFLFWLQIGQKAISIYIAPTQFRREKEKSLWKINQGLFIFCLHLS